ncbi:hypothetical protein [Ideonella sp. B508-1]|uniref:hypothetical protein n=1 Tax=Ideonella sp. B508-1 TaxID=137716 RepID=UPI0003B5F013|nr:hypothetical protein [Ideonella sp. B508-1]
MSTMHAFVLPSRLKPVAEIAALLQRLEASPLQVSPDQYRQVVQQLRQQLEQLSMDDALDKLLQAFPAAAVVYENLHYEQAGLCRAPLEISLNAELSAAAVIRALRAGSGRAPGA